ncbi:Hypothetical predicted protein [Olea europaea subsp. europaea]|uniref:Uncharacterized protein n=1 Tax=Olea europaea subsp. europaea TaxID=158383 RepID=A0A8S0VAT9_OLEEU|nr:Hypothetical predicted protein [Olea europaea subsp. europaea]
MEPCLNEQDMRANTGTVHVQGTWVIYEHIETYEGDIVPCLDDEHHPMPAATDKQLDGGAMEPSHAAPINDAEFEGCDVTDGDGDLTEVPVPTTIAEPGHRFPTTRWHSARLRRPAPATRTPYTRGRSEQRTKTGMNCRESMKIVL